MARALPQEVDTLVIGNGPSALILSYILHGHIPEYDLSNPHPDPILHEKLRHTKDLLSVDIDHVTEHFPASRFSYSTQALPINVLYDTLIRPYGDTEEKNSCVKWRYDASRAVAHIVVGNASRPGGQWVDNPVEASLDIGTLSYAGMLSLPGYGFDEYYKESTGTDLPYYLRPSRRRVAEYLALYPKSAGIGDSIYNGITLSGGSRCPEGFHFASHGLTCRHLVLASGIFDHLIPARPLLLPLTTLAPGPPSQPHLPILVVGSGFSAADVIISTPASQKIIHIFKWDPVNTPSPLRACHQQAYPEYAGVYRRMKVSALTSKTSRDPRPKMGRRRSSAFDQSRDWVANYEGLPNTEIVRVQLANAHSVVTLRNDSQEVFERHISRLVYVVGRRGSLRYLDSTLLSRLGLTTDDATELSAQTLRRQASENLEVTPDVFITGSLTGDSLIRFAYGSCVYAAGQIMERKAIPSGRPRNESLSGLKDTDLPAITSEVQKGSLVMNGLDGHNCAAHLREGGYNPLDRRKSVEEPDLPVIEARS